jgi:hypothetical protein
VVGVLAVFLALFATSALEVEPRAVPVFVKFLNANSTPLGVAAVALFAAWLSHRRRVWLLTIAVGAGGLLYPLLGAGIGVAAVAVIGVEAVTLSNPGPAPASVRDASSRELGPGSPPVSLRLRIRAAVDRRALVGIALGALPAGAYLSYLAAGGVGGDLVVATPSVIALHLLRGGLTIAPLAMLSAVGGAHSGRWIAAIAFFVMYVCFRAPAGTEYKFLMAALVVLAPSSARGLLALIDVRPRIGGLAGLVLCVPLALEVASHVGGSTPTAVMADGAVEPLQSAERDLILFLRGTEAHSVIVDRNRSTAAFARRPLLVGMGDDVEAGWGLTATDILIELEGHSPRDVQMRWVLASDLLAGTEVRGLDRLIGDRPVYVVLRQAPEAWPELARVFPGPTSQVVRLVPGEAR